MSGLCSNRRGFATGALLALWLIACAEEPAVEQAARGHERAQAASAPAGAATGRLYFLDVRGGRLLSADSHGGSPAVLVAGLRSTPDGIAVDPRGGHLFWTNMGAPSGDDGTVYRARLDGSEVTAIVGRGGTFTPKQLTWDAPSAQLYWSDREGMRIMRCGADGSGLTTLLSVAEGARARSDAANWAVGIAVDATAGYVYWTQKGPDDGHRGSIRRARLAPTPARSEVEVLFENLPEPIDLALDGRGRIYWSDRGDNTLNRAPLALPPGSTAATRTDREVLVRGLDEAIGLSLDPVQGDLYYTDLGGSVGTSKLDGSGARTLLRGQGALTGIAFVPRAADP